MVHPVHEKVAQACATLSPPATATSSSSGPRRSTGRQRPGNVQGRGSSPPDGPSGHSPGLREGRRSAVHGPMVTAVQVRTGCGIVWAIWPPGGQSHPRKRIGGADRGAQSGGDRPRQGANRRPAGHAVEPGPAERPEVHRPWQVVQWTLSAPLGTLRHHACLALQRRVSTHYQTDLSRTDNR
jgi:hypothetical protein